MAARTLTSTGRTPQAVVDSHPGRHSIVVDAQGRVCDLYVLTATGLLVLATPGHVQTLACGAGSGGDSSVGGGGGQVRDPVLWLPAGPHLVTIGAGSANSTTKAGDTSLGSLLFASGAIAASGSAGISQGGRPSGGAIGVNVGDVEGHGHWSDITGVLLEYGAGGHPASIGAPSATAYGHGGNGATAGVQGVLILRIVRR